MHNILRNGFFSSFLPFLLFLLVSVIDLFGFNYPSVSTFDPIEIGAGNQNWMIDQKDNGDVVIANERGLLIYNGAQFKLYEGSAPNAICVKGDRIYSGGYMDLGFWEQEPSGAYNYHSLLEKTGLQLIVDEQIWNIVKVEGGILFQSLDRLLYFDEENNAFNFIDVPNGISKLFESKGRIYFQDQKRQLFVLRDLSAELIFPAEAIPSSPIVNLFATDYGMMIFTSSKGFYQLEQAGFKHWPIGQNALIDANDFYSAQMLEDGSFALGSITSGLFLIDSKGNLIEHLNQQNSLSNNTVLQIFEDRNNNVWLGLDYGINVAHLSSPFQEYKDKEGQLGTVYASALYEGKLYLGTNQGLFYKNYHSQDRFSLVKNTNGQVWSLSIYDDELFCGHNLGTFIIRGANAKKIADHPGTWKIIPFFNRDDQLIQGNYDGIHLLSKEGGKWGYSTEIGNLSQSFRQFCTIGEYLYYYHASFGLNRFKISSSGDIQDQQTLYKSSISAQTSLIGLGNYLLFSTDRGLFISENDVDTLHKLDFGENPEINLLSEPGKLIKMSDKQVAFFQRSNLYILELTGEGISIKDFIFLDKNHYKSKIEYENITWLENNIYIIGMTNGYLLMNLDKIHSLPDEYHVAISDISVHQSNDSLRQVSSDLEEEFPFHENNFTFDFNVHNKLKYLSVMYQYKLEGERNVWSDWTTQSSVSYYKLKPGPYSFLVRARVGSHQSVNEARYTFWIKNPWYRSIYAIMIYFVLIVSSLLLINYLYKRVYRKRQRLLIEEAEKEMKYIKLKSEQELMKEKNERLRTEIESKNKELAVTAMSMVKKNEFLIEIREHLKEIESSPRFKPELTIRSINREIENEESWEMLKNAFENVDKDFIQTLLDKHPELTPNDLKLCTYLRLNMNSKEIATLMNISVRSMETKRYRLRKKLGLSHSTNLVEYILAI